MILAEGLEYTVSEDGSYYIVNEMGECTRKRFIISDSYNGKPVKAITEAAFYEKDIIKVVLPDSIERIEASAFCNCTSLKEVVLGNGLLTLGNKSFYGCRGLKSIVIPNSVTSIGDSVFHGCYKLKEIHYKGTKEKWLAIEKSDSWNYEIRSNYTIYCTDGEI